jgi:hypothetical protein
MSLYPLEKTTKNQLQKLGQVLWSWPPCNECDAGKACTSDNCRSKRSKRLERFFEYYKDLTRLYDPDLRAGEKAALNNHEDLLNIIRCLKMNPDIARAQLADDLFGSQPEPLKVVDADQERAINMAVKAMTMTDCSANHQSPNLLEQGAFQIPWRNNTPFSQFMSDIFPQTDHPSLNDHNAESPFDMKAGLTAKKLKKRAGISLLPTDDLRRHLKLDRKNRVVEIYHHTAFLKEHLRLTKDSPKNLTVSDSLRL